MLKRAALFLFVLTVVATSITAPGVAAQSPATTPAPRATIAPGAEAAQKPATTPAAVAPQATPVSQETRGFSPNVRVDVTITDQASAGATPIRKMISLTANPDRSMGSSVRSGVNVPMPSTVMSAAAAGGPQTVPITSYNYRTMGLSLDVRDVEIRENQVRLRLTVEYSPLDETEKPASPAGTPVSYSNFSQSFQLVIDNGKSVMAAETSDPVPNRTRKLSVEVKATILK